MRTLISALLIALAFSVPSPAAEPPRAVGVDLPDLPGPPQPLPHPMPGPDAPQRLGKGQWYVIGSDRPLLVLPDGEGRITVSHRNGPLTLPADVVVGRHPDADDPEFVTIAGPYVYAVKAAKSGRVTLQIIPALNALDSAGKPIPLTPADVVRRVLDVDEGAGPRPPPKPEPVTPAVAKLAMVVIEETARRTPQEGKVLLDKGIRDWLKVGGHTIDILDRSDAATTTNGYVPYADAVGLPAVLIFDATASGPQTPLKTFKLPATAAEFQQILGKVVNP